MVARAATADGLCSTCLAAEEDGGWGVWGGGSRRWLGEIGQERPLEGGGILKTPWVYIVLWNAHSVYVKWLGCAGASLGIRVLVTGLNLTLTRGYDCEDIWRITKKIPSLLHPWSTQAVKLFPFKMSREIHVLIKRPCLDSKMNSYKFLILKSQRTSGCKRHESTLRVLILK